MPLPRAALRAIFARVGRGGAALRRFTPKGTSGLGSKLSKFVSGSVKTVRGSAVGNKMTALAARKPGVMQMVRRTTDSAKGFAQRAGAGARHAILRPGEFNFSKLKARTMELRPGDLGKLKARTMELGSSAAAKARNLSGAASGLQSKFSHAAGSARSKVMSGLGNVSKTASAAANRAEIMKRAEHVKSTLSAAAQTAGSRIKAATPPGVGNAVRRVGQTASTAGTATARFARKNPWKVAAIGAGVGYAAGKRRQKNRMRSR